MHYRTGAENRTKQTLSWETILVLLMLAASLLSSQSPATEPCHFGSLAETGRSGKNVLTEPKEYFLANFLEFSQSALTRYVAHLYPELRWLTKSVTNSPKDAMSKPHAQSPSVQLYGPEGFHPEVDRTVTSILVLQQILANDYDAFTGPQPAAVKLPPNHFQEMREVFLKVLTKKNETILPTDSIEAIGSKIDLARLDALISYMAVHDTGKSKRFVDLAKKVLVEVDADHDRVLLRSLEQEPMMVVSFDKLEPEFRQTLFQAMKADFNMGQFAQAENLPGSLKGVSHLSEHELDFYYAHLLLDVAAAHGVDNPTGGKLMISPVYRGFRTGYRWLPELAKGKSPEEVYDGYLREMAGQLGMPMTSPEDRAMVRLALQGGTKDNAEAQQLLKVFQALPENARLLLVKELNKNGTNDGWGSLLYYAPQLIANARVGLKDRADLTAEQKYSEGTRLALMALARVYEQVRRENLKGKPGSGVYTVTITDLANLAKADPYAMEKKDFHFDAKADGADLKLIDPPSLDVQSLRPMSSLREIPGKRVIVIGYGGGTDGAQAGVVGRMLRSAGKEVMGVISVRRDKPGSLNADGTLPLSRDLSGPTGGEVVPGVTRILSQTRGTGRFVEHLTARDFATTQVSYDPKSGQVGGQLAAAIADLAKGDPNVTVIAIDTGGDSLYSKNAGVSGGKATPDQDYEILNALGKVLDNGNFVSAVVAPGIDTPADAAEKLKSISASFYRSDPAETQMILDTYRDWGLDGSTSLYGKTPLAWQEALRGSRGVVTVPLPAKIVLNEQNPWSPFVRVDHATAGVLFMDGAKHLGVINKAASDDGTNP